MSSTPEAKGSFHLVNGTANLPASLRGAVVAIGNFDGMHRGHQAVLAAASDMAERAGRPVVALTFEPHPRVIFRPDAHLFRLTPVAAKARLAAGLGLGGLVVEPFDTKLAQVDATQFLDDVLIRDLGAHAVVVGWDFHFGRDRQGTPAFLANMAPQRGLGVEIVPPFGAEDGEVVSSTRIRAALASAELGLANGLLGYRWFVVGEVVHGAKRGRELGIPTANMALDPSCDLAHGIYAVEMLVDGVSRMGVASYGKRPQFDNGPPLLETYLIDFSGDLYGKTCMVRFISYLRPEMKFVSVEALVTQMHADIAEARTVLSVVDRGSALDRALWGEG